MPKFIIESSGTVFYVSEVECETEEEARELFFGGWLEYKATDSLSFELDSIRLAD